MLIESLLDPPRVLRYSDRDWNHVLLQARHQGLLAKLEAVLASRGLVGEAPYKARAQMHAARIAALSSQTAVRFEVNRILHALRGCDMPIVLMKGAAYVHAGLAPAAGRFVGDVDLMVPRERIEEFERILVDKGWLAAQLDDYDQRYYRLWAHEIPPLQHPERDTPVDVHHTISPLTSRVRPDATAILAASRPLEDPRLRVMAPADMVLHSAVHLFNDEVSFPLRDLFDLHALIGDFSREPGFWDALCARARLHGLGRVLYHLLNHSHTLLGTEIPAAVRQSAVDHSEPHWLVRPLIAGVLHQHLVPAAPAGPDAFKQACDGVFYLRAHWLRMPMHLLVPHLARKSWKRWRGAQAEA